MALVSPEKGGNTKGAGCDNSTISRMDEQLINMPTSKKILVIDKYSYAPFEKSNNSAQ